MAFDYKKHLIKVQGNKMYLPVAARVVWFRELHPEWGIHTEIVELNHEKQYSIFRASIYNEEGKLIAMGTKKEDIKGFGDFLEKSESGAVGRALTMCGFGTPFEDDLNEGERLADSPRNYNGGGGNRGGQYNGGGGNYQNNAPANRPAPQNTRPAVEVAPAVEASAEASADKDARVAIKTECNELLKLLTPERKAYYKDAIPARYGSPLSSASFAAGDAKSLLSYLTYEKKSGNKADLAADPFADGPDTGKETV